MATLRNLHVEAALRREATAVAQEGQGVWRLALDRGALRSARACVADRWLDVRADIPHAARATRDDLSWLRFNAVLCGGVRVARALVHRVPHVRAEVLLGEDEDWVDGVASALAGLGDAIDRIDQPPAESDRHACKSDVRLPIETRAGTFVAGLEASPTGRERLAVDVMDVAGSAGPRRAQAALLMAVGSSVRTVTPMLVERDGALHARFAAPVAGPIDVALNRGLTALAAALQMSGRELQALHDEHLAADYLALWNTAHSHTPNNTTEEEPCLQQR